MTLRGVEVDIQVKVIGDHGRCVWSGVTTLLSRSKKAQKSGGSEQSTRKSETSIVEEDWQEGKFINVYIFINVFLSYRFT